MNDLLPELVTVSAAGLLLAVGRIGPHRAASPLWGWCCLFVLAGAAGLCMFSTGQTSDGSGSVVVDGLGRAGRLGCVLAAALFTLLGLDGGAARRASRASRPQGGDRLQGARVGGFGGKASCPPTGTGADPAADGSAGTHVGAAEGESGLPCPSPRQLGGLLFATAAGMLACVAGDVVLLFVSLELVAVSTWVLLAAADRNAARQAAATYFVTSIAASALLAYGLSFLYGLTGETNLAAIRAVLSNSYSPSDPARAVGGVSRLGIVAGVLVFAGLSIRLGVAPFHLPMPHIHAGADEWTAGILASLGRIGPFVILIRVLVDTWAGYELCGEVLALVLAGATVLVANARALTENRLPVVLAYLSMAQVGHALAGVAVGCWDAAHPPQSLHGSFGFPGGVQSAAYFGAAALLGWSGLSCALAGCAAWPRLQYTEQLHGWFSRSPLPAGCAGILLLSLAGMPPLPGFWGRWLVLASTLSVQAESTGAAGVVPHPGFMLLTLVLLAGWLMTAAVCLHLLFAILLTEPLSGTRAPARPVAVAAALLAAAVTLAWGLLPGRSFAPLEQLARPAGMSQHDPALLDAMAGNSPRTDSFGAGNVRHQSTNRNMTPMTTNNTAQNSIGMKNSECSRREGRSMHAPLPGSSGSRAGSFRLNARPSGQMIAAATTKPTSFGQPWSW